MRKYIVLLLLLLPCCLQAQRWNPSPTNQLVNDYSGMLSAEQRALLERRLVAFDDSTSNQILVIITPTLGGDEIMAAGTRVATAWGVGQAEHDNGLLILIKSKTDDEPYGDVAILPGYGLEGALPDAFCKHIIDDEMIEPLSDGNYYEALCEALDVIEPVCLGEYDYERYEKKGRADLFVLVGFIILVVVILVLVDAANRKKGGGKGDGGNFDEESGRHRRPTFWGTPMGGFGSSGSFGGGFGGGSFGGFGGGSFGGGGAHGRF